MQHVIIFFSFVQANSAATWLPRRPSAAQERQPLWRVGDGGSTGVLAFAQDKCAEGGPGGGLESVAGKDVEAGSEV